MTKRAELSDVIKCCETRFDRGEAITWKHGDFVDLHQEIRRDTSVNISPSTLKRIFGKTAVDEDYIPQQATLDALKKYGHYVEAANVKPVMQQEPVQQAQPQPAAQPQPTPPSQTVTRPGKGKRYSIMLILLVAGAAIIGMITWILRKPKDITAAISRTHTEGQLPATAFFELQLPETNDSIYINFGDKSPLKYVAPGEKKAAHIYYIPGVFTVAVQVRGQAIATASAYIPSGSWVGVAFQNQPDIPNHFYAFPAVKSGQDSLFLVTNKQHAEEGLDTTGLILTRLCHYMPVEQNADDFIFETTFRNALREKSSYCRGTQFQIAGSNAFIRFKFVSTGCSLRVINVISEKTFNGSTEDLSQFVLDLKQWNTVKLVNHQKQLSLYVNNKLIYAGTYLQPLGDIRGVFLEMEGVGLVKTCDLQSPDGKRLYHF